jgi:pimeloyl-ACP methyl ester carboxylesterase
LSNLTDYQRKLLDPLTAPSLDFMTSAMFAVGLGRSMFTPPRGPDDPAIAALADTFAYNDGMAVMHGTIQYLVERAEHETAWLEELTALPVKTTLIWGLCDTVAPLRVAAHVWDNYLVNKPGANEFWVLPRGNHYVQNDQPQEFVHVLEATLSNTSPQEPGPLSADAGAPVFVDRSRAQLPSATQVLTHGQG